MTTFRTAILLTIALTVSAAAHGQASAPSKQERATAAKASEKAKRSAPLEVRPAEIDRFVLKAMIEAFAINKASKFYFDKTTECDVQSTSPPPAPTTPTCTNTVKITELFNGSGDLVACSVSTGDIKLVYGPSPRRPKVTISWDLQYPSSQKAKDYAFEDKVGLLILKNDYGATGNKIDAWSKAHIQLDHKWKKKDDEVYYYPLVMQTLPDGTLTLCGATDPRITND